MNNDLNDLVKRGAVCDMLHEEMGAWGNCADEIEALLKANDALWKIPAVDAVAVCRCKDCKHIRPEVDAYTQEVVGCWCSFLDLGSIQDEHFCSYGERRSDGA